MKRKRNSGLLTIFAKSSTLDAGLLSMFWMWTFLKNIYTAWKVSKYGVISGPYLDTFHAVLLLQNTLPWVVFKSYIKLLCLVHYVLHLSEDNKVTNLYHYSWLHNKNYRPTSVKVKQNKSKVNVFSEDENYQ